MAKRSLKLTSFFEVLMLMLNCVRLFCDPMDCSPPGSSVHGIFQAEILEWIAISSTRGSSPPRDRTYVSFFSCIGRWILLPLSHLRILRSRLLLLSRFSRVRLCEAPQMAAPGSPVPGIFQTRTLEWVAISFSSA